MKPLGATVTLATAGVGMMSGEDSHKVESADAKMLTHDFLLKQASAVAADAVARILTELTTAIEDVHEEYCESMIRLLSLMQNNSKQLSNCSGQDELWLELIAVRSQTRDLKAKAAALESRLRSVSDLVEALAQVAFVNGAEYAGIAVNERMMSAERHVRESARRVAELERELGETEKSIILAGDDAQDKGEDASLV